MSEAEAMEFDVIIVGAGAAGLSCAYRLADQKPGINIVVLEKASEVGAQSLSGAVLKTAALQELIPDFRNQEFPLESEVKSDAVYYLTKTGAIKFPITPPPFHNKGNLIVSLSQMNRWLAKKCEEKGVQIFPGFAAVEALYEGDQIVGILTGDKGRDKNGNPKGNFEPGMHLKAKVVIFAEGTRGSLFKKVAQKLNLREGRQPEAFEEGVKEIIQMPAGTVQAGQVIHTLGFPLHKSIGGTFIYTLPNDRIILGLVAYLDSKDPYLDPHKELQKLKTHPWIFKMIQGGKVIAYGGKTLPAGGWYAMPKLAGNGWMVCGDTASMVDVQKLKGIHLAMKSGMLAAETALKALAAADFSQKTLHAYEENLRASFVGLELKRVRNFHQALSKGLIASLPHLLAQELTGGRGFVDPMPSHVDAKTTEAVLKAWGPDYDPTKELPKPDGILFFDKLSSVYLTGTFHDEDSPNHLHLQNGDTCRTICEPTYKSPCVHFCPANVYEMVPSTTHADSKELKINYTNCIHCKTCDIKCPFENIDWTAPEGGGGPKYQLT